MNKRGVEPVMWIIISAILALTVLIVIGFIFGDTIKGFVGGVRKCSIKQGECVPENNCQEGNVIAISDCPSGQVCCLT